jgi:hypothetical protein
MPWNIEWMSSNQIRRYSVAFLRFSFRWPSLSIPWWHYSSFLPTITKGIPSQGIIGTDSGWGSRNRTFLTRTDKTIKPNKKDSKHLRMSPMKRFICINYNVTIRKKQQYKSFDLVVKGYNFSIYVYEVLFEHPLSMFSDIILTPILDILIDNIFFILAVSKKNIMQYQCSSFTSHKNNTT